jgi:hypothetical protein
MPAKTISGRNPENRAISIPIFHLECILKATDSNALQKFIESN